MITCDPASLTGHLKPTRRGIEMAARFATVVHQQCSRCLAPFAHPLEVQFRLFLLPPADEDGAQPYEDIPEDDPDAVDLYPLEGPVVDFAAVLREQVDLALPMRAVCRENCRGLCPSCGADLNATPCRCEPARDERFSQLEQLKVLLQQRSRGGDPAGGR